MSSQKEVRPCEGAARGAHERPGGRAGRPAPSRPGADGAAAPLSSADATALMRDLEAIAARLDPPTREQLQKLGTDPAMATNGDFVRGWMLGAAKAAAEDLRAIARHGRIRPRRRPRSVPITDLPLPGEIRARLAAKE